MIGTELERGRNAEMVEWQLQKTVTTRIGTSKC